MCVRTTHQPTNHTPKPQPQTPKPKPQTFKDILLIKFLMRLKRVRIWLLPRFIHSQDFKISLSNNTGEESLNTDKILRTLWWKLSRACTCASNSSFANIKSWNDWKQQTDSIESQTWIPTAKSMYPHFHLREPENQCLLNKINRALSLFCILLQCV